MHTKKFFSIILLLLAVAAGWSAWQSQTAKQDTQSGRITVTDSLDRRVEIPAAPKRIVFLNASNLDLFCAAGGAKAVAGIPTSNALSTEVKAAVSGVPEVGVIHSPDVEKIMELKPDLVIGINVPFHQALIATLEQAGIPMLIKSLDSYEQVMDTLKFYGSLTGDAKLAEEKIAAINKEYQAQLDKTAGKTAPRNMVIFGAPDSFSMGTKKSFTGDLIERLGGNNIADIMLPDNDSAYVPLSMEAVAKQNPEVMFVIMHGAPEQVEKTIRRDLLENPAWKDISAVRNQRVYVLPYQLFAVNPGVQVVDAVKVLAKYLYP